MLASNMEEDAFYMGEPTQRAEYQSWAAQFHKLDADGNGYGIVRA